MTSHAGDLAPPGTFRWPRSAGARDLRRVVPCCSGVECPRGRSCGRDRSRATRESRGRERWREEKNEASIASCKTGFALLPIQIVTRREQSLSATGIQVHQCTLIA
ncbi:hypothetical protein RB7648 [Rhodopirellula baltica SH 1]|uniref:Uncharacterized protein n=1 Tax=Rhodopirellula baltica (strain DSM 10527 / NCIMB 13988 / SH1) TaxID=243090 RepID=Q7UNC9_RHOBA|nr:hypothetical protein RB7648 [Rhodopirellula baltica SH 1]